MGRSDDDATVDRDHVPVRDDLAGPTLADNERHAIARAAFLRHLLTDDRVIRLFAVWARRLGLNVGMQDSAEKVDEIMQSALRRAEVVRPRTVEEAIDLTRAAGLAWAWLPVELIQAFWLDARGRLEGVQYQVRFWTDPPETPVRRAVLHVESIEGESWETLADRLGDAVGAFLVDAGMTSQTPVGRSVTDDEVAKIERDVELFYRARVKEPAESVAGLARASDIEGDPRRSVYDAIERAERLLGIGRFELQ